MGVPSEWEQVAENWVAWARTPAHDAYWQYRHSFFDRIVPAPGRRTVEVGCGEGRVSRDLRDRGHRVVGVDLSPTLLRHARDADDVTAYVRADAARLPLADRSCDLVVSYNALMDIVDMEGAVAEAARVLDPGGRFCVCITHPMNNSGHFDGPDPDAPFRVTGTYFGRRRFEVTVERDGLTMSFRGWSHALEDYVRALADAGFVIEAMAEPVPASATPYLAQWCRVPMFLHIRAAKA
jgi:SAM-dependent methyltransferase